LPLALETRSYIPRLLALAAIIKNPAKYGVSLPPVSAKPYLELVDSKSMSLTKIAKLSSMSVKELKELNPGVKNSSAVIKQGQLALPIDRVALYKQQLAAANASTSYKLANTGSGRELAVKQGKASHIQLVSKPVKENSEQIHLVKGGDTLEAIAKHYHVSVKQIQVWNQLSSDFLKPGEKLKIMLS